MANSRRRRAPAPAPPPPVPLEEVDPRDALQAILTDLGAETDYQVRVTRMSESRPRRWQHVAVMDLTPNLIEDVQAQFGGGDYRGLVYDGQRYVQGKTIKFSIAGRAKDIDTDSDENDRLARLEARIEQLLTTPPPKESSNEAVALVTTIIGALTPLMKGGNSDSGPSLVELMTLRDNAEKRGEERGLELGKLQAGGGDGMGDVVKSFMPSIITLLQHNQTAAVPRLRAPGAPAPVDNPQPTPPMPAEVLAPEWQFLLSLRPFYLHLEREATSGIDPELVAENVLAHVDNNLAGAITAATMREDFKPTMQRELAGIQQAAPQWLAQFLEAIVTECAPDIQPPAASTPRNRKASNR